MKSVILLIYIPLCIYFNVTVRVIESVSNKFTFHYVSISTFKLSIHPIVNTYLHSTMYLFQLLLRFLTSLLATRFTFHYVSISTLSIVLLIMQKHNLHSTMYLFQLTNNISSCIIRAIYIPLCIYFNDISAEIESAAFKFTFHYVSISTHVVCALNSVGKVFTFHYVSISTSIH